MLQHLRKGAIKAFLTWLFFFGTLWVSMFPMRLVVGKEFGNGFVDQARSEWQLVAAIYGAALLLAVFLSFTYVWKDKESHRRARELSAEVLDALGSGFAVLGSAAFIFGPREIEEAALCVVSFVCSITMHAAARSLCAHSLDQGEHQPLRE